MDKSDVLLCFSALGQSTRLDVFRELIKAGEKGLLAGDIGDMLDVKQNTMSANLAILLTSGLISNRREGRFIRYFANMDSVRDFLDFLLKDCCGGNPNLCQPVLYEIACHA